MIRREVVTFYRNLDLEKPGLMAYELRCEPGDGFTLPTYAARWFTGDRMIATTQWVDTLAEAEGALLEAPKPSGKCDRCAGPVYLSCAAACGYCAECGQRKSLRDMYIDGEDVI